VARLGQRNVDPAVADLADPGRVFSTAAIENDQFLPGPEPQDTNQVPARGFVQRCLARTIQLLTVIYPAEPHPFNPPLLVVVPMAVDCRRA